MRVNRITTTLLIACTPCLAFAQLADRPICSPPPPRFSEPLRPAEFDKVRADILNGDRPQALTEAEAILNAHPTNAEASFIIGTLLLDYEKPAEALVCFRHAEAAWPDSTDVHAGLLEAYAETGDRQNRDIERAILRGFHNDGHHPIAAKTTGIVIERFHAGDRTVEAVEYFVPQGNDHIWYRFTVTGDKGMILGSYSFATSDADQSLYQQQHPDVVGSTLHRFALESSFAGTASSLGTIDGAPTYDDFRTRIAGIVQAETVTASATDTTGTSTATTNTPR